TAGFKTITATVTDDDGGAGAALSTVDVNSPPDCNPVTPSPNTLWPANHKFATITLSGATDPDGDTVTLTVNGVTQDEPVNGVGDGDGRFYRITFGGDDARGGTCTATKDVTVRHNPGRAPIDSGGVFNSF